MKENAANTSFTGNWSMLTLSMPCVDAMMCISWPSKVVFSALFALVILIGLAGNLFVILTIVLSKKLLQASINLFLLNLALADLGNIIFCVPDIVMVIHDRGWILPALTCPLVRALQEYFLYASVLLQVSIGVERFMAIVRPMRRKRMSRSFSMRLIAGSWLLAAVFAVPYSVYHRRWSLPPPRQMFSVCFWHEISAWMKTAFKYSECLILYLVPLLLLAVIYTVTSCSLWGADTVRLHENERQAVAVLRLRRSVIKMLIISMLVYFLCYSPIQAIVIIGAVTQQQVQMGHSARLGVHVLALASSAANPIVYTLCCRQFSAKFCSLLRRMAGNNPTVRDPYTVVTLATAMAVPTVANDSANGTASSDGISLLTWMRRAATVRKSSLFNEELMTAL